MGGFQNNLTEDWRSTTCICWPHISRQEDEEILQRNVLRLRIIQHWIFWRLIFSPVFFVISLKAPGFFVFGGVGEGLMFPPLLIISLPSTFWCRDLLHIWNFFISHISTLLPSRETLQIIATILPCGFFNFLLLIFFKI